MKVTNPHKDREIIATVALVQNDPDTLTTFVLPAGESEEIEDYAVASTLVEYGAVATAQDLAAARVLWAERNRTINSRTASAAASEGEIIARQQVTTDVATGSTDGGAVAPLKGAELDNAVRQANESGAKIPTSGSADERREALARWQAVQGSSTPPTQTGQYVTTETGDLYLDDDGNPVEVADVQTDANGQVVYEDGKPVPREAVPSSDVPTEATTGTPPPPA